MLLLFSTGVADCLASHMVINSLERDGFRKAELCPRHTMMKEKRCRQKKRWEDNIKEWLVGWLFWA